MQKSQKTEDNFGSLVKIQNRFFTQGEQINLMADKIHQLYVRTRDTSGAKPSETITRPNDDQMSKKTIVKDNPQTSIFSKHVRARKIRGEFRAPSFEDPSERS